MVLIHPVFITSDTARRRDSMTAGRIPSLVTPCGDRLQLAGRALWKPVEALGMWAREHQPEIESARARFDGRNEAG
jgi:hypothetical protein